MEAKQLIDDKLPVLIDLKTLVKPDARLSETAITFFMICSHEDIATISSLLAHRHTNVVFNCYKSHHRTLFVCVGAVGHVNTWPSVSFTENELVIDSSGERAFVIGDFTDDDLLIVEDPEDPKNKLRVAIPQTNELIYAMRFRDEIKCRRIKLDRGLGIEHQLLLHDGWNKFTSIVYEHFGFIKYTDVGSDVLQKIARTICVDKNGNQSLFINYGGGKTSKTANICEMKKLMTNSSTNDIPNAKAKALAILGDDENPRKMKMLAFLPSCVEDGKPFRSYYRFTLESSFTIPTDKHHFLRETNICAHRPYLPCFTIIHSPTGCFAVYVNFESTGTTQEQNSADKKIQRVVQVTHPSAWCMPSSYLVFQSSGLFDSIQFVGIVSDNLFYAIQNVYLY